MSKLALAIAFPAYGGHVAAEHAKMWFELGNVLGASQDRFALRMFGYIDVNPVDRARNLALAMAMQAGADWLFMIDADTWVVNDGDVDAGFMIARMISEAAHAGATVAIAPVARRELTGDGLKEIMAYRIDGGDRSDHRIRDHQPIELANERRGLVTIDAGATACMAINLNEIVNYEALFQFSDLSEDLHFCRQVRMHGGKILCDTRVRTGHLARQRPIFSTEESSR